MAEPPSLDFGDCPVCVSPMNAESSHVLECGHRFHVKCIMRWFREGGRSCPMCRDRGEDAKNLTYMDVDARASYLRRKARNKRAPKELKRLYNALLRAEANEKKAKDEYNAFLQENKEVQTEYKKLRRRRWDSASKTRKMKRQLGLFSSIEYPIPIVVPRRRQREFF